MKTGLKAGKDLFIAIDAASTELYDETKKEYNLEKEGKILTGSQMVDLYEKWVNDYPIISIEDGFAEEDWETWKEASERLNSKVQLVGDDLFVTNTEKTFRGIK